MTNNTDKNCFTIADIHNIRYEIYTKTKNMTNNEIIEQTKNDASYGLEFLMTLKSSKNIEKEIN